MMTTMTMVGRGRRCSAEGGADGDAGREKERGGDRKGRGRKRIG